MLIEAFRQGADFHEQTALKIFGADSGRDPHELRSTAKMVNYALLYGKTRVHAREGHRRHAAGGAGVHRRLLRRLPARPRVHRPHARGGARHRRGEDDVRPAAAGAGAEQPQLPDPRSAAEREAVNMPIQGTAADIMKRAMIEVHAALALDAERADDSDRPRRAAVRSAEGERPRRSPQSSASGCRRRRS